MKKKITDFIISKHQSVRDALRIINKNRQKTCFVVDKDFKLLGSIADGDIRRKFLKNGKSLREKIDKYYNKNLVFLRENKFNNTKIKKIFLRSKIEILPVINGYNKIIDVILKSEIFNLKKKKNLKNKFLNKIKVVIMAGGKGKRLDPITRVFPKPLVPIKDKTAIENIIKNFSNFGVKIYYLILNYKAELIKAFFKSKKNLNQKIFYIDEKKPLGTAGGLAKLKNKIRGSFIVTNCDIFFNFDLRKLIKYHAKSRNDFTLVSSNQISNLPYGLCKLDINSNLIKIIEKPKFENLITVGMYVMKSSVLNQIKNNEYLDMNTLIEILLKKKFKVGIYKILKNNWQDIGQLRDYKKNLNSLSV